jgi:hypothetical protein
MRRAFVYSGIALLLGLAAAVAVLLAFRSPIRLDRETLDRLRPGMTMAEVEEWIDGSRD